MGTIRETERIASVGRAGGHCMTSFSSVEAEHIVSAAGALLRGEAITPTWFICGYRMEFSGGDL